MSYMAVVLRPASREDAELLFTWANDPDVRRVSFSTAPIPWEEHVDWLEARLRDPDALVFVALSEGASVGTVRFELRGDRATISVALAPHARGRGLGQQTVAAGVEEVLRATSVSVVNAVVKDGNAASKQAFLAAGFSVDGRMSVGGEPAIRLTRHR